MILLHAINDDILIPHLSYSGVYQYEPKNEISTKRSYFWGWNETKKTDKTVVYVPPSIFGFLNKAATFLKVGWV